MLLLRETAARYLTAFGHRIQGFTNLLAILWNVYLEQSTVVIVNVAGTPRIISLPTTGLGDGRFLPRGALQLLAWGRQPPE